MKTCSHPEKADNPITRYDATVGHFVPMRVCRSCLGPTYLGGAGDGVSMYQVTREKPMMWRPNGR